MQIYMEIKIYSCHKKHHTLICFSSSKKEENVQDSAASTSNSTTGSSVSVCFSSADKSTLLSTTCIEVLDCHGNYQPVRCLLDSGSMTSFICQKTLRRLGLRPMKTSANIQGLGSTQSNTNLGGVTISFKPVRKSSPILTTDALVLTKICEDQPLCNLEVNTWPHIANLKLADDNFFRRGSIDILLGADVFSTILLDGRIYGNQDQPDAINTIFGYVLMGKVNISKAPTLTSLFCQVEDTVSLDQQIKKFWELVEKCL
uniref:Uncharacterized protein LOC114346989 n=1 Tax=Diabrotica virgifera virgifera TaxID=50390 RepID=A0A6P7GUU4_DIAVI